MKDSINERNVQIQELIKTKVPQGTKKKLKNKNTEVEKEKPMKLVVVGSEAEVDKIIEKKVQIDAMIRKKVKHGIIANLTKSKEVIGQCSQSKAGWRRISLAVDSGACESVIDAEEQVPEYEVKETQASRSGLAYSSATGEEILNLGEVTLPFVTKEGTKRSMKLQAAGVSRPLASVKRICEAGHFVVFDDEGSYIYNKSTGEINILREESGNYLFDVWVPLSKNSVFGRPR